MPLLHSIDFDNSLKVTHQYVCSQKKRDQTCCRMSTCVVGLIVSVACTALPPPNSGMINIPLLLPPSPVIDTKTSSRTPPTSFFILSSMPCQDFPPPALSLPGEEEAFRLVVAEEEASLEDDPGCCLGLTGRRGGLEEEEEEEE